MSRSVKKTACFKDQAHKSDKRLANKRIRKFIKKSEVGFKGINFFHKLFNSYDISDWAFWPINKEQKVKALKK